MLPVENYCSVGKSDEDHRPILPSLRQPAQGSVGPLPLPPPWLHAPSPRPFVCPHALPSSRCPLPFLGAVSASTSLAYPGVAVDTVATDVRAGRWQLRPPFPNKRSAGRTWGIVGYGRIGQSVARKAAGFDWRLLGCDPYIDRIEIRRGGVETADFETQLAQSDLGSIDILGRPLRIQLELKACRLVRDVSRLIIVIDRTNLSAKSREGPRRTPKALRIFSAQLRGPSRISTLLPHIAVLTNVNEP